VSKAKLRGSAYDWQDLHRLLRPSERVEQETIIAGIELHFCKLKDLTELEAYVVADAKKGARNEPLGGRLRAEIRDRFQTLAVHVSRSSGAAARAVLLPCGASRWFLDQGGAIRNDLRRRAGQQPVFPPSVFRFVSVGLLPVRAAFVSARSRGPTLGRASRPPGPLRGCPASAFPVSP
jgi:hypothetical protein